MAVELKKNYTNHILVGLLLVASFLIGSLYTKVTFLEKGVTPTGILGTQAGVGNTTPGAAGNLPARPTPGAKVDVKLTDNDPSQGNANAKVTVIEFADFQCPYCGAFSGDNQAMVKNMQSSDPSWQPAEPNIEKDYVKTGKVRFVWKDYPFLGAESNYSAEAARCAQDQGKFWEFHDYLYSHQGGENQGAFSKDNLKKFAGEMGLNASDFNNCLDNGKYTQFIKDAKTSGDGYGVNGTPATFVNGVLISGAAPYSQFKAAIDAALK